MSDSSIPSLKTQSVVFIDANVPDLQDLLSGLAPGEEAFVIEPSSDGLAQIASILAANDLTDLSSISIVAHGASGQIVLGSSVLNAGNLESDSAALSQIGAALMPDGALQLYSCDVGSGAVGQQFIADLSQYAGGATVDASDQIIGQTADGENWALDDSTDPSATQPSAPFTTQAEASFQGDLSVTPIVEDQRSIGLNQLVLESGLFAQRGSATSDPQGIPVGSLLTFAGSTSIGGTAAADGQSLSTSTDPSLFSILSDTYGGNGTSTYDLPNLQDRLAVGTGTGSNPLGDSFGADQVTLGLANMPTLYGGGDQSFSNDQPSLQISYLINTGGMLEGNGGTDALGDIIPFLGNFAPNGYMLAQGQLLAIASNTALFDLIGTTYGGDGVSTFALPNLTGNTIIGAGTSNGTTYTLGEELGQNSTTITNANLPTSSDTSISNDQPSLVLNYIICVKGSLPSTSGSIPTGEAVLGEILAYAGPAADVPGNWELCDGQLLSISANQDLFSVLGTTYGGNGISTFALPNLQGLSVAGIGTLTGGQSVTLGEQYGSSSITLSESNITVPPLTAPKLAAASQTGKTDDTAIDTPVITGQILPGWTAQLMDGNTLLETEAPDSSGNYTFVVPALPVGTSTTLSVIEALGSLSETSPGLTLSIDPQQAYFILSTGAITAQIWTSNGTTATRISPTSDFTDPDSLTQVGTELFFVDAANGALWVTNGMSDATIALTGAGLTPQDLTAVGQTLFFINAADSALWTSNGTGSGTAVVGAANGLAAEDLTAVGNTLFFVDAHTDDLWRANSGTASEVGNFGTPTDLTAVDNELFFVDSSTGTLWESNGTAAGTVQITADAGSFSSPTDLTAIQGRLYFVDSTGALWLTDADTPGAAKQVSNLHPSDLTAVGSNLYFVTTSGALEEEVNFQNRDTITTNQVADLTAVGNDLYFVETANDTLWITGNDGTAKVASLGTSDLGDFTSVNGDLYFEDSGQLWIATTNGAQAASNLSGNATLSDITAGPVAVINQAPVAKTPHTAYSAIAGNLLDLKDTGLSVSDVDGGTGSETVTLSVGQGTLTVTAGNSGVTVNSGNATPSVEFSGTIAKLNALLGSGGTGDVTYVDNASPLDASTVLTLLIDDNGNSGAGGALSDSATATIDLAPCYCPGTLIRTERGEKRVETLKIGDQVMTASGVLRPIKWIGRRSYDGRFVLGRKDILPVCIRAGALDDNVPRRDLWISPHHAMYLQGILIEAKDLINGLSIVQAERPAKVEYIHVELDSHDVIVAEGALSESFIDDDSRGMFHNAHEYRTLYGDEAAASARYCAPRCDSGFEVETARRRIALRAGLLREADLPRAGDLCGFIDRIGPDAIEGWAQDTVHPEAPVCLDIYAGGRLIGQALANSYREDLKNAGLGSGCHGFSFAVPPALALQRESIEIRRCLDGTALAFSATCHGEKRPIAKSRAGRAAKAQLCA